MAATATTEFRTIALADQLIRLRQRVPLLNADIATATGVAATRVRDWLERVDAPSGQVAMRLSELIAACEQLEVTMKPDAIASWLHVPVASLDGCTPAAVLADGGYERIVAIAEDLKYPTFT